MSSYIDSKTPTQYRSHHQKMIKKYNTIQNVIEELGSKSFTSVKAKVELNMQANL